MKFKPFWSPYGAFCGWTFGKHTLNISARAVAYRARVMLQAGQASPDLWRSFKDSLPYVNPDSNNFSAILYYINLAHSVFNLPIPL